MPITTNFPVGRIVSGNPSKGELKTNFQSGAAVLDKEGKQIIQYRCKVAYPKADFMNFILPIFYREAATAFPLGPNGVPNVPADFAWKFVDGDSPACPKRSKIPYNVREGYPGHYIVDISTEAFAPKIFQRTGPNTFVQVAEGVLKCGDFVVPNVDVKVHANNDGGLYINPNMFEFVGQGTEIISQGAANPEEAFGQQQYQLPVGARPIGAAPMAPAGAPLQAPAPVYAPAPVAQYAPPAAPAPQYAPPAAPAPVYAPQPAAPAQLPPPHGTFVQNAGGYVAPQPVAPQYAPAPVAQYALAPLPAAPLPAMPIAPVATSYHSNPGMPPLPPQR